MKLSELKSGEKGLILRVEGKGALRKRISEMGFVRGQHVKVIKNAPLKDPVEYEIMGYYLSLRKSESDLIIVSQESDEGETIELKEIDKSCESVNLNEKEEKISSNIDKNSKVINVAFIGNPNSGKTSLFNFISGLNEHVGNYSGVTVDSKEAEISFSNYTIRITDLPGTYSLSTYSPEELYVRNYIRDNQPDVIVNVLDGSNLERNLYLTTQLIDLNANIVVALNMYDELQNSGSFFNHQEMGRLLNAPFVPTVAKKGKGVARLMQSIVNCYEDESISANKVKVGYGQYIESWLDRIEHRLEDSNHTKFQNRYVAIKLLEGDADVSLLITDKKAQKSVNCAVNDIEKEYGEACESVLTDARYGFISGALKETYRKNVSRKKETEQIDSIVTHKFWGIPIFVMIIWFMFYCTFTFGEFPVMLIEWIVELLQKAAISTIPSGAFQDLISEGIIGGVGSVIVFLPNILLLFLFISFLEDSGYMARAAFIMDKLMHKIGLHGKSFIPLVMGFGCNVPAIMSTRIIEDRNNRLLTMLILPFMSCSARLPVYMLLISAFFPDNGSTVLFAIYLIGILFAIITSLLFRKVLFREKDNPFVMELPPYRMPTLRSIIKHMWQKGSQYLQKMGGVILVAVVIVWVLSYYPKREIIAENYASKVELVENSTTLSSVEKDEQLHKIEEQISFEHSQNSYLGRLGKSVEPIFKPLGFDWKMSIGLLSGIAAKEIIVSTIGVLNQVEDGEENQTKLAERLQQDKYQDGTYVFNKGVAFSFLVFVLIYFPCIAVVTTIRRESGSIKLALLTVVYSSALAWIASFCVYQIFG
ncbi:MAG: ferrous iron transport protein B [Rikenellaceae bacterium]